MDIITVKNRSIRALNVTARILQESIRQRDSSTNNRIPSDVEFALRRFFNTRTTNFLDILLSRIRLVIPTVHNVHLRILSADSFNPRTHSSIETLHLAALAQGMPALTFPSEHYIALYNPFWEEKGQYQPGVLIHECFHYYFGHMRGHPRENRRINAFAYQGLICYLGRLPIGPGVISNLGIHPRN